MSINDWYIDFIFKCSLRPMFSAQLVFYSLCSGQLSSFTMSWKKEKSAFCAPSYEELNELIVSLAWRTWLFDLAFLVVSFHYIHEYLHHMQCSATIPPHWDVLLCFIHIRTWIPGCVGKTVNECVDTSPFWETMSASKISTMTCTNLSLAFAMPEWSGFLTAAFDKTDLQWSWFASECACCNKTKW